MNELMNFTHQRRNFDPELAGHATVIGAGSVGGWVAHDLAKFGCQRLTVFDFDHVESHNVPPSVYSVNDIGFYKVQRLQAFVKDRAGLEIRAHAERFQGQRLVPGPVVASVDTMASRIAIWERVRGKPYIPVLVDTRIDDDFVHVIAVDPCDPADHERYGMLLYPDSETNKPTCGRHAVRQVTSLAAAFALGCLKAAWKGETRSREIRMYAGSLRYVGGRIGDVWYDGDRAASVAEVA